MPKPHCGLAWYTRRVDQGQMIEVSYAYSGDGNAYRRVHDRCDRTTTYAVGQLDWSREPAGIDYDRAPCVVQWVPCAAPREEED